MFVTGRHRAIVEDAIRHWNLPSPDFVIGDVGTSIYQIKDGQWHTLEAWQDQIGVDWANVSRAELADQFAGFDALTLQEPEKQGRYKLSYYAPADLDVAPLRTELLEQLADRGIKAQVVWSVDETKPIGLLDILPASADKLQALRFLIAHLGVDEQSVMFAGDSGNDLPILTSGLQAVLVANAHETVHASLADYDDAHKCNLYLARGGFEGMNGNYAAGILEGLAHFGFAV